MWLDKTGQEEVIENLDEDDIRLIKSTYNIMGKSLTMSGGPVPKFKDDEIIYEGVEIGWLKQSYADVLEGEGMNLSDPADSIREIRELGAIEFIRTRLLEVSLTISFDKNIDNYGFRSEENDLVERLGKDSLIEKHTVRSKKIFLGFKEMDLILDKKALQKMDEEELENRMCVKVVFPKI